MSYTRVWLVKRPSFKLILVLVQTQTTAVWIINSYKLNTFCPQLICQNWNPSYVSKREFWHILTLGKKQEQNGRVHQLFTYFVKVCNCQVKSTIFSYSILTGFSILMSKNLYLHFLFRMVWNKMFYHHCS